jgi:hypothetical protein
VLEHWAIQAQKPRRSRKGFAVLSEPPADDGDGDRHGDDDGRPGLPLSNARLGMLMFGAETMFWLTIGRFGVSSPIKRPADLPSLPVGVTSINTFASSMRPHYVARPACHTHRTAQSAIRFGVYGFLGVAFLTIQAMNGCS